MPLLLLVLVTLFGLWVTWCVVYRCDIELLRIEVAEPIFSDVPDMTYDARGMV